MKLRSSEKRTVRRSAPETTWLLVTTPVGAVAQADDEARARGGAAAGGVVEGVVIGEGAAFLEGHAEFVAEGEGEAVVAEKAAHAAAQFLIVLPLFLNLGCDLDDGRPDLFHEAGPVAQLGSGGGGRDGEKGGSKQSGGGQSWQGRAARGRAAGAEERDGAAERAGEKVMGVGSRDSAGRVARRRAAKEGAARRRGARSEARDGRVAAGMKTRDALLCETVAPASGARKRCRLRTAASGRSAVRPRSEEREPLSVSG